MSVAAVLGGGPSLPADMQLLPKGCILISVNHHSLRLCQPDYLVYMDNPQKVPALRDALQTFKGKVVSPFADSDVKLEKGRYYDGGFSSALATWFALSSGFEQVLLCGMDCYQGEHKYFYDREGFYHPVFDAPLENHLRSWRLVAKHCPNPERIHAMSGPLTEVFGQYKKNG